MMITTGRTKGGRKRPAHLIRALIAFIGLMLSPLTPWNDSFVNVPLSIAIALLLRPLIGFDKGYWFGYALTNIAGLALLAIASKEDLKKINLKSVVSSLLFAIIVYIILHLVLNV